MRKLVPYFSFNSVRRSLSCLACCVTLLSASLLVACNSTGDSTAVPVLTVAGGQIAGKACATEGVSLYTGVPYAAPPVGELRWRKPQPVVAWEGVRDCTATPPAAPQTVGQSGSFYWKEFHQEKDTLFSEDCLYLNVWTPAAGQKDAKLPVMMWIHGGGFNGGHGMEYEFDGEALARQGVILVTINYRLGPLGFMVHPLLTAENGGKGSGNYGLFDQLAALKWIRQNISAFGGDPDCITVFGQSAGAGSVQALISSRCSQGEIARVIIQSGGGLRNLIQLTPLAEAEQRGVDFWSEEGLTSLEQARRIPAEQLLQMSADFVARHSGGNFLYLPFSVNIDGELLTEPLDATALKGGEHNIPYLIGYNSEDINTEMMHQAAVDWSLLLEEQGRQPAYVYRFSRDLPGEDMEPDLEHGIFSLPGAFHSSELWYVFGTLSRCWRPMEEHDYDLSRRMVSYWTNFAKTGNPNGEGLSEWRPLRKDDMFIQELN